MSYNGLKTVKFWHLKIATANNGRIFIVQIYQPIRRIFEAAPGAKADYCSQEFFDVSLCCLQVPEGTKCHCGSLVLLQSTVGQQLGLN